MYLYAFFLLSSRVNNLLTAMFVAVTLIIFDLLVKKNVLSKKETIKVDSGIIRRTQNCGRLYVNQGIAGLPNLTTFLGFNNTCQGIAPLTNSVTKAPSAKWIHK